MRNRRLLMLAGLVAVLATLVAVVPALAAVIDEAAAQARCITSYPGVSGPDPLSACQWDMSAIKAGAAQAKATGNGVKVGVIDGGVDFTHPDLTGAIDVAQSCSFI